MPVALMIKQHERALYLFAVAMRQGETTATFTLRGLDGGKSVEVLGEGRSLLASAGSFKDQFGPWAVHLYRLTP